MTIETADFVGELDQTLPTDDNDFVFEGDDHFRLVKKTLVQSFANVLGAVTITHDELNTLTGITGNVETRLDALEADPSIPSGSKIVFLQNAAPVGWTFDATLNDEVLKVTNVELDGGTSGGDWNITGLSVDPHVLTVPEIPAHTHDYQRARGTPNDQNNDVGGVGVRTIGYNTQITDSQGGGGGHVHGLTSDSTWRPAYINVIACIKN